MSDRSEIDAVKAALSDPLDVCRRLGLEHGAWKQSGGLHIVCPAHADRGPSCSVTRGRDGTLRVKCFGCTLSGDIFDLVAAVEHLDRTNDFAAVLAAAARLASVSLEERPRQPAPPAAPPGPEQLDAEAFDALVAPLLHLGRLETDQEIEEREGVSPITEDVVAYLSGRGLLDVARAEGWAALPPPGPAQESWVAMLLDVFGPELVARSGLVHHGATFLHAESRLVIPWRDQVGRVVTLQRRRLDDDHKPKYVFPPARAAKLPYGLHRLGPGPIAWVEGAVDTGALAELCSARGQIVNVLGIPGVQGWRSSWARLCEGREAVIALDADDAGERAIAQLARDLGEAGAIKVSRWKPAAKDWAKLFEHEAKAA